MIFLKENVLNLHCQTYSIRDLFGGGTSPATLCFNNLYFFILSIYLFIYLFCFIYLFIFIYFFFLPIILFYYSLVVAALLGQSPRVVVLPT